MPDGPSTDVRPQSLDDDGSSNRGGSGTNDDDKQPQPREPSTPLQRSVYIVFLVLLYGAAALYAWVIICILTNRPIGGVGYGLDQLDDILENPPTDRGGKDVPEYLDALYAKSERHLRAARIVLALVSVLTIPLASAVCSQAAVVYIQRKRGDNRPTLRQTMALADKGWTDIFLLTRLVFRGWKQYRSSLLLFALFLSVLGAAIFPVQQLFLSFETIKRVGFPVTLPALTDFTDLVPESGSGKDTGEDAVRLRPILASTVNSNVQTRLWSSSDDIVSIDDISRQAGLSRSSFQSNSQNTLANITTIQDPFWAELPSGTNTGLLQQFAPRVNSTATWEDSAAATLPEDCNPSSDAFYLHYQFDNELFQYDIEICMPGNMSQSPWENQMSRQDIREELYFKMDYSGQFDTVVFSGITPSPDPGTYSSKLTLDTTRGYFELPNYANGQVPGPLLEEHPFTNSTSQLVGQRKLAARDVDDDSAWRTVNATHDLIYVGNKGPLLSIAMALFGEASFVDVQHTAFAAYINSDVGYGGCIGLVPFVSLLRESASDSISSSFTPCLNGPGEIGDRESNYLQMHALVAAYFWYFSGDPSAARSERIENAFTSAAFLANDVRMRDTYGGPSILISYNMGADVQVPHISRAGIIFVSVLLGLFLLCLLGLAVYSAWTPRWAEKLDAFAMLRIGASISEKVPLLAAHHVGRIRALDETPGWIGNASDGEIGELSLAGERPLRSTRHYRSYSTDDRGSRATGTRRPSGAVKREGYSLVSPDQSA